MKEGEPRYRGEFHQRHRRYIEKDFGDGQGRHSRSTQRDSGAIHWPVARHRYLRIAMDSQQAVRLEDQDTFSFVRFSGKTSLDQKLVGVELMEPIEGIG